MPRAVKYAGTVHPLVVASYDEGAEEWSLDGAAEINEIWGWDDWAGPIQLVVCPGRETVKVGPCSGTYTRQSDGKAGKVIRYRETAIVRVVVAATGEILESKTVANGSTPTCATSLAGGAVRNADDPPPWEIVGDPVEVSDDRINEYATSLLGAGLFDADRLSGPFNVSGEPVGTSAATPKELAQAVIDDALEQASYDEEDGTVPLTQTDSDCIGPSTGVIVRSSTGGVPAIIVVDIAIPCLDTPDSPFAYSAGYRVEMTLANDKKVSVWTATKATAQLYCPRGYDDVERTCHAPSQDDRPVLALSQEELDWCDANAVDVFQVEGEQGTRGTPLSPEEPAWRLACRTAYAPQ